MILIATKIARALAAYAEELEKSPLLQAAKTLPGYAAWVGAMEESTRVEPLTETELEQVRKVWGSDH
jgi:hypothetical protein